MNKDVLPQAGSPKRPWELESLSAIQRSRKGARCVHGCTQFNRDALKYSMPPLRTRCQFSEPDDKHPSPPHLPGVVGGECLTSGLLQVRRATCGKRSMKCRPRRSGRRHQRSMDCCACVLLTELVVSAPETRPKWPVRTADESQTPTRPGGVKCVVLWVIVARHAITSHASSVVDTRPFVCPQRVCWTTRCTSKCTNITV